MTQGTPQGNPQPDPHNDGRASVALRRLIEEYPAPHMTLADLIAGMEHRAYGFLMLLLAIPSLVPIPGVSTVFGLPLLAVAFGFALGRPRPWLPRRLAAKSLTKAELLRVIDTAEPRMARLEKFLKPRLPAVAADRVQHLAGAVCAVMAVLLILPIVAGNFLPALTVVIFALGIVERDGAFILAGFITSIFAVLWVAALVFFGVEILSLLLNRASLWFAS